MNEKQFMTELEHSLIKVPKQEREDMLNDYEEHFSIGMEEEGKTEEEVSRALGSPQKIAKEMLAAYHLEKAESNTTIGNVFRAVWAGIGLGFFNLIIVLGPFIGLLGIVFAGWIVGITFIASPFLAFIDVILTEILNWFSIFVSLIMCGVGIFISVGMLAFTRVIRQWVVRYLKFNTSLVKGGLKHES